MIKRLSMGLKVIAYVFIPMYVILNSLSRIFSMVFLNEDFTLNIVLKEYHFYISIVAMIVVLLVIIFGEKLEIKKVNNSLLKGILFFAVFYVWDKLVNYISQIFSLNDDINLNIIYVIIIEIILILSAKAIDVTINKSDNLRG